VFTARADKDDANLLHWSVVTLPAPSRYAERRDEDERATRRRKIAGAVEIKPSPARCPTVPLRRWIASPFPPMRWRGSSSP